MEVILIMWPLIAVIAAMVIGKQKGRTGEGLLLGLLLGPLGCLYVFLGPDKARTQYAFCAGDALDDSNHASLARGRILAAACLEQNAPAVLADESERG